jgi:hypothetical protein
VCMCITARACGIGVGDPTAPPWQRGLLLEEAAMCNVAAAWHPAGLAIFSCTIVPSAQPLAATEGGGKGGLFTGRRGWGKGGLLDWLR